MVAQCLAPLAAGDSVENDGFFDIVNGIDDAESVVSGQIRAPLAIWPIFNALSGV